MSLITTIIDGIAPNPSSGLGGANEGHIQGFQDDIINGIAGGVADKAGGQCLVTQNSPLGMSVLVADGVVYVPNADYIANLATATKYYRVVIKAEDPVTIPSNTSGDTCQHGLDVVIDKVTVPNEYGSNIATLVVTLGTPGAGAPAVPDNGYRLAEVEVVDGATQIANVSIIDTRTQIAINDVVISTNIVTKTGTQTLSNKTLTSPVINTGVTGTALASASDVTTGTEDAKIVTPKAIADSYIGGALSTTTNSYGIYNTSMARQAIINGSCVVSQRAAANLATTKAYGGVDRIYGIAEGTVGAGTITQISTSTIGTTGYAIKLAGVTLTGAGKAKIGYRMEAKDAVNYKNQTASFSCRVLHDVGSAKTYTIYVNKANSADNFAAVTAIGNNGGTSVESATDTLIKYQNISLGDCSNGLEIIIENNCGAVTTKNFEFTELQFNKGDVVLPFQPKSFEEEYSSCSRYYWKTYADGTAAGTATTTGRIEYSSSGGNYAACSLLLPVQMRIGTTSSVYSTGGTINKIYNSAATADVNGVATIQNGKTIIVNVNNVATTAGQSLYCHVVCDGEL